MGGIQSALLNVAITAALPFAVDMVKNMLTRDHINLYGDKVFDFCEDFILGTSIKVDDKFALPFLLSMREMMATPDLDDNADRVKEAALPFLTDMLGKVFNDEKRQVYGDKLFDLVEDFIANTETKVDDKIGLPVLKHMREILVIPDLPDKGILRDILMNPEPIKIERAETNTEE